VRDRHSHLVGNRLLLLMIPSGFGCIVKAFLHFPSSHMYIIRTTYVKNSLHFKGSQPACRERQRIRSKASREGTCIFLLTKQLALHLWAIQAFRQGKTPVLFEGDVSPPAILSICVIAAHDRQRCSASCFVRRKIHPQKALVFYLGERPVWQDE
jgi:hypothetical protein